MIICFDLETTGLDKYNDEIIEIAMIKFDEISFEIIDTFSTFVNPGIDIPEIISNITSIFNNDVVSSPSLNDIKKEVIEFIGNSTLLGHNVFFDRDFFIEKGIDISNNIIIDTFFLANFLNFSEASLNLELLCKYYKINFIGAHRAINDAKATIKLFEKLISTFIKLSRTKKELLYFIFNNSQDKNIDYLKNYLFKNDYKEIGFNEFENKLLKNIRKYSDEKKIIMDNNLDNIDINDIFKTLGNLETRDNQKKMMTRVFNNFENKGKLVIEAPTGLGKSFAYLLPSIIHSLRTNQKVFITTKTKTLQDQLFYKDLDFLNKNLDFDFNYTKLKGRKNYLSLKGFFDEIYSGDYIYEKVSFFSKIVLWLFKTEFGELDDLNYYGKEFSFLRYINSELSFLNDNKNLYTEYDFLYKARQNLLYSNIIIINHSLLFSDLNSKNNILGNIDNLVVDEAHNIEDSVTESLRKKISLDLLLDIFSKTENIMTKYNINKINFINIKESLFSKLDLIFDYSFSYLNTKVLDDAYNKNCLISDDFFSDIDFVDLLKKIELDFIFIIDTLSIIPEHNFANEIVLLNENIDNLKIILNNNLNNKYIKIIGYNQNFGISLEYTLLNPGEYLISNLYNRVNSILLTSATLKIGDSFDYFKKILSLENFEFVAFDSDFDYKKQSTIFIPNDLGNIKNNIGLVVDFLNEFYAIVGGKTLTLFTSFNIIRKVYTSVNQNLKKLGINLYAQSIGGSKVKLLEFFLESPSNSILLGTDSFWEGVDIPGDNLKYLIIHKFPFQVPNDPIFQSRSKFFKDPFLEYSIPKAIIKLKQGFGRLIRSYQDTGVIILLDDRIYNTKWGQEFYKAFPLDINIKNGSSKQFFQVLKKIKK